MNQNTTGGLQVCPTCGRCPTCGKGGNNFGYFPPSVPCADVSPCSGQSLNTSG